MSKMAAFIESSGFYVPERKVPNSWFENKLDTSDEWIQTRTGIKNRHFAAQGENASDLAFVAAKKALANAAVAPAEVSHILFATMTPDEYCPNSACSLAEKLGLRDIMALDINAACTSFIYALQVANALAIADENALVLVAASEVLSRRLNFEDRSSCVLFGDGAGVTLVSGSARHARMRSSLSAQVLDNKTGCNGSLGELLRVSGGGSACSYEAGQTIGDEYFLRMNGREVYKHAVRNMDTVSREVVGRSGFELADIDLFIPHQANVRIIEAVGKKLGFDSERVFVNVSNYGNTSAASCAMAFAEASELGRIKPGMRVLLTSFGGGFTWGSALLQF